MEEIGMGIQSGQYKIYKDVHRKKLSERLSVYKRAISQVSSGIIMEYTWLPYSAKKAMMDEAHTKTGSIFVENPKGLLICYNN